ncbi:conserved hypothetical protein [Mycobacterium marinum M]|uniref:Transmembrane protein n=2 Tax=Mycobacterium marinum TaxID=1781 RepID=B2HFT7_MYCMM|nr:DUF5631 domain-containing protein [Mycobacterium marinum]ACC41501.1 conserved hypothetical protein [Mycobacterium marinum M]MDC9007441.1 DUF5631 domain-containing protein [Mycobacterium marinum]
MGADLPPGRWSAWLVGPWWPAPPGSPAAGVSYWRQAGEIKQNEARDLQIERSRLAVNQGRTADDLMGRYWRGEQSLSATGEQCDTKSVQSGRVVDAVNNLRDRLRDIAHSGNGEIDRILSEKRPIEAIVAAVNAVIARANTDAANAGAAAMSNIIDATQRVLDTTIGGNARTWLREHGVDLDNAPPSRPITALDLNAQLAAPSTLSAYASAQATTTSGPYAAAPTEPAAYGGTQPLNISLPDVAPTDPPATLAYGGTQVPISAPRGNMPPPLAPPSPGAPAVGVGGPSIPGVSTPAASAPPLSPQSLAQSFTNGMSTGAPAAAGANSISAGAMTAATEPPPPTTAPPAAPLIPPSTVPATGAGFTHVPDAGLGAAPTSPPPVAPPTSDMTGGVTTVAPMMAGGPVTGSVAPAVGAPAGPLPAYGSDLRPPTVAPPAVPSAPTGPVSGAPVASPSSSPSAGGSMVSPVAKSSAHDAAQAQTTSGPTSMAGATAAATTGAVTGDSAKRSAEQQRLRRIVDAVARQEPGLSWAAGLRDDGRTTLLVTDLAGGWIPPHVRLPSHVTLLEPATRRSDIGAADLLGAVTISAVHQPHGYIGEPGRDAPKLAGDRAARIAPEIDELGPTLAEHVRRRDGLPRVAQVVAVAAARNYGVPDNEAELLRDRASDIHRSVLAAYPHHDLAEATDWMLLAAIDALIDGNRTAANYHLAWAMAAMSMRRPT